MIPRINDGVCQPIPPSEYLAWERLFRPIVRAEEYAILATMDRAYCSEMNKEFAEQREREKDG